MSTLGLHDASPITLTAVEAIAEGQLVGIDANNNAIVYPGYGTLVGVCEHPGEAGKPVAVRYLRDAATVSLIAGSAIAANATVYAAATGRVDDARTATNGPVIGRAMHAAAAAADRVVVLPWAAGENELYRTGTAEGAIAIGDLVQLDTTSGKVELCVATGRPIGVAVTASASDGDAITYRALRSGDIVRLTAASSIGVGALVYCAASGDADDDSGSGANTLLGRNVGGAATGTVLVQLF